MDITIVDYQPFVKINVFDHGDALISLDFLMDTGFTGTIAFGVSANWDLFKIINLADVKELPPEKWVSFANGKNSKTFSANISIETADSCMEVVPIIIFESEKNEPPLLGMKFLEMFHLDLLISFSQQTFRVQ